MIWVFFEEFGATVNLTLPGIVSEKERLLLKLLMEGMSVTEISQYRNRSAKTISHQKKQLYEKLGIQSDITFWRDIFFNIIRKSLVAREIKIIFISLITVVTISSRLKPSVWRWKTMNLNRGSNRFSARRLGYWRAVKCLSAGNIHKRESSRRISLFLWRSHPVLLS